MHGVRGLGGQDTPPEKSFYTHRIDLSLPNLGTQVDRRVGILQLESSEFCWACTSSLLQR